MGFFRSKPRHDPEGAHRELAGDLEGALHIYLRDGRDDEACRVTLAIADREEDPRRRLDWILRAVPLSHGSPAVRARYALARVDLGVRHPSTLLPSEADALGRELLSLGDSEGAARAFRLAGSVDAESAAWAAAGDVENTEYALARGLAASRAERARVDLASRFELLVATGQRRDAISLVRRVALAGDPLFATADALEARLVRWPHVALVSAGASARWILGDEVVVGRSGCELDIPAAGVSRRHLRLSRNASGDIVATDVGSSNGTWVASARLQQPFVVRHDVELGLGPDVRISLASREDGLHLDAAGARYVLPLGIARLGGAALVRVGEHIRLLPVEAAQPPSISGVSAPEGIDLAVGDLVRTSGVDVEVAAR